MIGKSIDKILYDISKTIISDITLIYAKCEIISICLDVLRNDPSYFERLNSISQKDLDYTISAIQEIQTELTKILKPISEELK